ncbi:CLUMA_CG013556, isoform A [Clunio marinus]|uniref:Coiled-coil domain-containing protein 167 n=1 Tax=Clunio marinus TaxID=568069 RepID=A0A1J1IJ82_9DIPT|nr:CLUMA_CG013556, isoform A [Clunio marinus]
MQFNDSCPISKQTESIAETIQDLNTRIRSLEIKLTYLNPDSSEKKTLATEIGEIKKLVSAHENNLKQLRKNNRTSFIFCALLIFLIFLIYCTYVLIYGY